MPSGAGNTARQIQLLRDLDVDALKCMPSYALYLAETIEENDEDPAALPISVITVGAEPSTKEMRDRIAELFNVVVTENYGLSEMFGPGVASECVEARDGQHIWEDHFYPEIIDPDTGQRLAEGKEGELVLTSLTKEGMPLLRYRTGDLATLTTDRCDCGRTHARIHLTGRVDDMLIIRGVNVYPSEIEQVLLEVDELKPQYRIDLTTEQNLDRIEITVEHAPGFNGNRAALAERLKEKLASTLMLTPDDVTVVQPRTLARSEVGKIQRIFDNRT